MDSLRRRTLPPPPQAPVTTTLSPSHLPEAPLLKRTKHKQPQPVRRKRRTVWRFILWLCFIVCIAWGGYFTWKVDNISKAIRQENHNQSNRPALADFPSLAASFISPSRKTLKGEENGRVNILLLGKAGEHYPGRDLTDTIMIMSLDTKHHKIALLSLPRDLYVPIPNTQTFTKINAVYQYSLSDRQDASVIRETVESVTHLPIHYSFIIDFEGFEKIINTLGGITVDVERDIYDTRYPGPHYSYETFKLDKGWQQLDGATALKYVRERHDDPEGDFGRAKRQQQVIQAVKNKVFSAQTFLNAFTLNDLLSILGESVRTNIAPDEIESFIALSKQMDTQNITNVVVDAWKPDSLLRVSHVQVGPTRMFILVPRVGNWSEIQDLAANLFDLDIIHRRQEEIQKEASSIAIINLSNKPGLTSKVSKLLKESLHVDTIRTINVPSSTPKQSQSFIIDRTETPKPFTLDGILRKLTLSTDDPSFSIPASAADNDFIIILGSDTEKALDFEEDSIEDFHKSEEDQENNEVYPSSVLDTR